MIQRLRQQGFTLLEVVIALIILCLSLMAIFDLNAGAVRAHVYTKRLTVASLLARSKMTDIEQELYDKGFNNDDEEKGGDFSEEGWSSFKWRAKIVAPKTQGLSPQQLISAIFNFPMPGGDSKDGKNPMGDLGPLAMLFAPPGMAQAPPGSQTDPLAALGPMGAMAQTQFTQMIDQITKAVREVHLTVSWKEGTKTESIDIVTHVVSLGPGSDRNGGAAAEDLANAGLPPTTGDYVNSVTGAPVPNPMNGPNGLVDPSDGVTPVISRQQWQAAHGGQLPGGVGALPGALNGVGGIPAVPGFAPGFKSMPRGLPPRGQLFDE